MDGATIEIESMSQIRQLSRAAAWSISPAADKQSCNHQLVTPPMTTTRRTAAAAAASWTPALRGELRPSGTRNGRVGPYTSQEAADEAANSARDAAIAELQGRSATHAVNACSQQLPKPRIGRALQFRYEEIAVPYGFEKYWGSNGSYQTLTVPANSSNNAYLMRNAEWSLAGQYPRKPTAKPATRLPPSPSMKFIQWDSVSR